MLLETASFVWHANDNSTQSGDLSNKLKNRSLRASTVSRRQKVKTEVKAGSEQ